MKIEIRSEAYDPWQELSRYQDQMLPGSYGATAVFVGTMRDLNEGDDVEAMLLEHYPGMTENQLLPDVLILVSKSKGAVVDEPKKVSSR